MSIKKKLGLGIASAALGLSLVGGGTFAYFSDTATQMNHFSSGTLDISVNPTTNVNISNLKPGDWTEKTFQLINGGTIDIGNVLLHTKFNVTKSNGDTISNALANEFASQIIVDFLINTGDDGKDHEIEVVASKSLLQLRDMTPEELAKEFEAVVPSPSVTKKFVLTDGIKANSGNKSVDDFKVKFRFNETDAPQNQLQDLKLNLEWTFEGRQTAGEERN
ncbi:TasA family protein [Bacillus sp. S/N-304-OC-R1]|uniref:TasA family protein n=1 Tax=Bacillus sp. S/N-304-OC-R1 TaxID=2758034 RepID=UPI001C8DE182|nr:TasA family protein [Bacillus sp. S/N-304-OC-R1]MBY0122946.1 spore coat protein [Bacillus sp. S/N-304-OC-R1]